MLMLFPLIVVGCSKSASELVQFADSGEIVTTGGTATVADDEEAVDPADWELAAEALTNMGIGWNLGNTLDVVVNGNEWFARGRTPTPSDYETFWGNPVTKPVLMEKFAQAGFGFIRVPVTWGEKMDADYNIDEAWMDRVQEVVDYVIDNGMYCILNMHHDTGESGWLKADADNYDAISERFKACWTQVAERFKDYDYHLIFEGFNEILDNDNHWSSGIDSEDLKMVNTLNQDFVNTVRASDSENNRHRNLICTTYAASHSEEVLDAFRMPKDSVCTGRLMAEIHMYSPYNFALNEEKSVAPDYQYNIFRPEYEEEIIQTMTKLKAKFTRRLKVPLVIGEWGATKKDNLEERCKHAVCMVKYATKYGFACAQWMGMISTTDRNKAGVWTEPELRDAIMDTYLEVTSVRPVYED